MSTADGGDRVYCRECGAEIRRASEICPECGVRQRPTGVPALETALDGRNPLVAAVLSAIFPGLGHVYAREIERGVLFAALFLAAGVSLFFLVGIVLVPAVWLYAIYDAARAAQRRSREPPRPPGASEA
jgi:TM2 domain-containing membrane protein YozV